MKFLGPSLSLALIIFNFIFILPQHPLTWFNGAVTVLLIWSSFIFWRTFYRLRKRKHTLNEWRHFDDAA